MLEAQSLKNKKTPIHSDMNNLLTELNFYRSQSAKLKKVNDLYRKIASTTDLSTLLETYSIWLTQFVPHILIAYNNDSYQRMHLYSSNHGLEKRQAVETAKSLFNNKKLTGIQYFDTSEFHAHCWDFESPDNCGQFIFLRKESPMTHEEQNMITESVEILAGPLQKALDFENIFQQARKDTLTGLPNRRVFDEQIPNIIEQARRHNHGLTLATMDLDNFKQVNDTKGHLYGDTVLKLVTKTLQKEIRLSDLLVRMGGDEFILVLTDTEQKAAINLCERLYKSINSLEIDAGPKKLGLSIGLMQWDQVMDVEEWLEKADDILYQMKAQGGRGVTVN